MAIGKILVGVGLAKLAITGVVALGLSTGLFKGCDSNNTIDKKIQLPDTVTVSLPVTGYYDTPETGVIRYHGMPSDSVFSTSGMGNAAVNEYYRVSSKKINMFDKEYFVKKVTPDSLILQYTK